MNQGWMVVESNNKLSIAVPTYNRAAFIDFFLSELRSYVELHGVDVYVCDNASIDGTRDILERHAKDSSHIRSHRNEATIRPDENFEKALSYADSDYVWLLGDTYLIPEKTLIAVKAALDEDEYDVVVMNVSDRVEGIEEQVYTDRNKLLADLGWHMTCLSTLVYSRKVLQNANYARYRDTNFLQTGIIFEYLADKPFKVKWIPQHSVEGIELPGVKKSSWEDETFEIWTKRWANFVFSLPASYDLDAKLKCIMDHGKKSGVFTFKSLNRLRKKDILTLASYHRHSRYLPLTVGVPKFVVRLIATWPKIISRLFC